MLLELLILLVFSLYIFFEIYQLRYFFEKNYNAITFSSDRMDCKQVSLFSDNPIIVIAWNDITSVTLIQGFLSGWKWHQNLNKKLGLGVYDRLIIKTSAQGIFVFHSLTASNIRPFSLVYKKINSNNKNRELLDELARHSIFVKTETITLSQALLSKEKDWYRKT